MCAMADPYVFHYSFTCTIYMQNYNTLQHTATHCNTLQHTATHHNTLQHTATHCNTLQHYSATHCNTRQHTATQCNAHCHTLQHTATHSATQRTILRNTLCNTPCNTLQTLRTGMEVTLLNERVTDICAQAHQHSSVITIAALGQLV